MHIHTCNYVQTHTPCACVPCHAEQEEHREATFLKYKCPSADAGSTEVAFPRGPVFFTHKAEPPSACAVLKAWC